MPPTILIIAEHIDGRLLPVTFELAAFAQRIQAYRPAGIKSIILGEGVTEMAHEISRLAAIDAVAVEIPGLVSPDATVYKIVLSEIVLQLNPLCICAAHTSRGLDFISGLAVKINAPCITGVIDVNWEAYRFRFSRTIYGGKIVADVIPETEPFIIALQPGVVRPPPSPEDRLAGNVEIRAFTAPSRSSRNLGTWRAQTDNMGLAQASIVVSAGRGIGKKENLDLIQRLAAFFPKSAVGGSRLLCDMGWIEYRQQVGVTGTTVAPDLYIACGISGAFQHIAGMRNSGFIVAINTDPNAAIFNISDVCIVEDITTFIPTLLKLLEEPDRFSSAEEKQLVDQ